LYFKRIEEGAKMVEISEKEFLQLKAKRLMEQSLKSEQWKGLPVEIRQEIFVFALFVDRYLGKEEEAQQ
jgi:hypothetical protein